MSEGILYPGELVCSIHDESIALFPVLDVVSRSVAPIPRGCPEMFTDDLGFVVASMFKYVYVLSHAGVGWRWESSFRLLVPTSEIDHG